MTTASTQDTTRTLFCSFELGAAKWLLTFGARGDARSVRKEIYSGDAGALTSAMKYARSRFELPADAPVLSCYEAGRDGFFPHRLLESLGVQNIVIDPSSILVDRRSKRVKTDRIDGNMLLALLMRHYGAERKEDRLKVVRVPTLQQEMNRLRDRDIKALKDERQAHRNRIKGLLALMGACPRTCQRVPELKNLVCWDGSPLPPEMLALLEREQERLALVESQIRELERERQAMTRPVKASKPKASTAAETATTSETASTPASISASTDVEIRDLEDEMVICDVVIKQRTRLETLKAVGPSTSSILVNELFAWRDFRNVKELASCTGLVGAPWQSGEVNREQGITKAGNKLVRWALVQLAHGWLMHQPQSELSQWYRRRFAAGSRGERKKGIVALARKLLIALWKFVKGGEAPAGAMLKAS